MDPPSRELMFAVIDRIEIDQYRNVEIKYKFNLIKKIVLNMKNLMVQEILMDQRGKWDN